MNPDRFVHYRMGYAQIDDAHLALLTSLTRLITKIKTDNLYYSEFSVDMLNMIQVIILQFEYDIELEEKMMYEAREYPYMIYHLKDHDAMKLEIDSLIESVKFEQYPIAVKHLFDLDAIFINHIDHYDRQFYEWYSKTNMLLR